MAEYADPENTLVIETTKGNVVIEMRPDLAPNHVAHIKKLAREGFYDGIVFHRVIDGFMAQTGCPQGRGTGGSKYPDLKQEFSAEPHVRGTASMARAQNPDSANSQFFICFGDTPFLNKQYTVWGQVIEGMDNVDKIKRGEPVSIRTRWSRSRSPPTSRPKARAALGRTPPLLTPGPSARGFSMSRTGLRYQRTFACVWIPFSGP